MELRDKIKFIYFDLDNTLWNFKKNTLIALKKVYNAIDFPKGKDISFEYFSNIYTTYNEELWRAYERGEATAQDLKISRFNKTLEKLDIKNNADPGKLNDIYVENLEQQTHLMPNAREILDYLGNKYKLGIITNGFKKGQHKKMKSSNIIHFFNTIITSDGAGVGKPHPKIFRDAIEQSGFKAEEIAYIGDDYRVDTLGANNEGILGILLDPDSRVEDNNIIKLTNLIELKEYF